MFLPADDRGALDIISSEFSGKFPFQVDVSSTPSVESTRFKNWESMREFAVPR
jgi:hypothetical protein